MGHGWVKDRFITPAPPLTPIRDTYTVADTSGAQRKLERTRIFVPSTVFDNQALLSNDPNYLANLAMLPEAEKNALLYGSWDSFDGQVFREWRNDPAHYDDHLYTHVINPFRIPKEWKGQALLRFWLCKAVCGGMDRLRSGWKDVSDP